MTFYNFTTYDYFLFLSVVCFFYWSVANRFRPYILLLASLLFYCSWDFRFYPLIVLSASIDYFASQRISLGKNKRIYLLLSLITNLGMLISFKYLGFLDNIFTFKYFSFKNIVLPLGISFYTFQTIGHTIDVYRGKTKSEPNFLIFLLYVSYFPQLLAGPIERSHSLIPQFTKCNFFKEIDWRSSIELILSGLFYKLAVSASIFQFVQFVETNHFPNVLQLLLSSLLFPIHIYCDFCGYTKIARGSSLLFNIKISRNFRNPLFCNNPSAFWNSWHITLSNWVKNYLFLPLASKTRNITVTIIITMTLIGLWHGQEFKYAIWGLFWALITILYKKISLNSKFIFYLFISLSFCLFRVDQLSSITNIQWIKWHSIPSFSSLIIFLVIFLFYEYLQVRTQKELIIKKNSFYLQSFIYLFLYFIYRNFSGLSELDFIYFDF